MIEINENRPERYSNKEPFFSIIIVSYNYEQYLRRALTAIKRQTFKDYEIVIVDNGSTDNTDRIVRNFMHNNKDMYITHVRIDINNGLPNGRNKGIDNSHGEYIIFNDADDWMDKTCLEEMYKASENGTIDRIVFQFRDVSTDGKILQVRNYTDNMSIWLIALLQGNAFKRRVFEEYNIRVPNNSIDDAYIAMHFSKHTTNYKIVCRTVYNYYINMDSTSGVNTVNNPQRVIHMMKDMIVIADEVRNGLDSEEWEKLEYQLIKFYYFIIFHYNRGKRFKDFRRSYGIIHSIMKNYDKNYLNNPYITIFNNGDRFYGRIIAALFGKAEKYHLMAVVIYVYAFLSKIIYFNV